jgi:hypothetical protein
MIDRIVFYQSFGEKLRERSLFFLNPPAGLRVDTSRLGSFARVNPYYVYPAPVIKCYHFLFYIVVLWTT